MGKVLALMGSPRRKGNTETVLDMVTEPLAEAGHKVTKVYVCNLRIEGCQEFFDCQKRLDAPACRIEDDMVHLEEEMLSADLTIWATPVYMSGMTSQLKAAVDRCYAFMKFSPEHALLQSLLEGRKWALVVTAGGDAFDGADIVVTQFRRIAQFARLNWLGQFCAPLLQSPEATRANAALQERAAGFGRELAEQLRGA